MASEGGSEAWRQGRRRGVVEVEVEEVDVDVDGRPDDDVEATPSSPPPGASFLPQRTRLFPGDLSFLSWFFSRLRARSLRDVCFVCERRRKRMDELMTMNDGQVLKMSFCSIGSLLFFLPSPGL